MAAVCQRLPRQEVPEVDDPADPRTIPTWLICLQRHYPAASLLTTRFLLMKSPAMGELSLHPCFAPEPTCGTGGLAACVPLSSLQAAHGISGELLELHCSCLVESYAAGTRQLTSAAGGASYAHPQLWLEIDPAGADGQHDLRTASRDPMRLIQARHLLQPVPPGNLL